MSQGSTQTATEAAARVLSPIRLYRAHCRKSSLIDEILGHLVISLECPRTTAVERATVLDRIDRLIRMKIDLGFLRGGRR